MLDSFDELVFLSACGMGLIVFGVGKVFFKSRKTHAVLALAAAAVALGGSWAVSPNAAYSESILGAGVVSVAAFGWLLTRSRVKGWILRPGVVGAAFATCGAGLIAAGSWHYDYITGYAKANELEFIEKMAMWHPDLAVADLDAKTDDGHSVTLWAATAPRAKPKVRDDERAMLAGFDWAKRVIERSPGDDVSNCHGWVFTGGKYWIKGHEVPVILNGNGYKAQKFPRVGDVAAYFDDRGNIAHTGLVRSVGAVTMVESKWGWMGVYLHAAEDSCYGTKIVYYHGTRKGPQLAAINPEHAEPAPRFGRGFAERPPIR